MSKNVVIIGTQWGDEGKGKVVDLITDKVSSVVRFQGGHNAARTMRLNHCNDRLVPKPWNNLHYKHRTQHLYGIRKP
jgi:adenylosuccinate synthase